MPECELCSDRGKIRAQALDYSSPAHFLDCCRCPDCLAREKNTEIAGLARAASKAARGYAKELVAKEKANAELQGKCLEQEILWAGMVAENAGLRQTLVNGVCAEPSDKHHWHDWTIAAKKILAETETNDA